MWPWPYVWVDISSAPLLCPGSGALSMVAGFRRVVTGEASGPDPLSCRSWKRGPLILGLWLRAAGYQVFLEDAPRTRNVIQSTDSFKREMLRSSVEVERFYCRGFLARHLSLRRMGGVWRPRCACRARLSLAKDNHRSKPAHASQSTI